MSSEIFHPEHEDNFLIILMRDEDKLYDVMGSFHPTMFHSNINQVIADAVLMLAKSGTTPTHDIVKAFLETKKKVDKAGGEGHLDFLAQKEVDPNAFKLYFNSVVDSYRGRKLLELSQRIPLQVHNTDNMTDTLRNVTSYLAELESESVQNGIKSIDELMVTAWDLVEKRREGGGGLIGVSTGFPSLDEVTGGYVEGDVWIISGRPSHGKSTALLKSFKEAADEKNELANTGAPCMLFNREMNYTDLMYRMIAMDREIPYQDIKNGNLSDHQMEKGARGSRVLGKLPIYLDSNYYGNINYVTSAIRKYHKLHGVRLVGIDYVQLLAERGADQTAELGRISRELKLLAMDLGLTVVILSQLNRNVEQREDKRPILADLRQSGNLEEDADTVVALYRDEMYNENSPLAGTIEFRILKQRNGPLGVHTMKFKGKYLQIIDEQSPIEYDFSTGGDNDGEIEG